MSDETNATTETTPEQPQSQEQPPAEQPPACDTVLTMQLEITDFTIDMPDIPLPQEAGASSVCDAFPQESAVNFAFLGSGQGGGRLAEAFYRLGYRRVAAVNTALQDLGGLQALPEENKKLIDQGGAGKDPAYAEKVFRTHRDEMYELMSRSFGDDVDRIILCIGGGGGTGGGSAKVLIPIAHELLQALGVETDPVNDPRVGVICTLPTAGESPQVQANSYWLTRMLLQAASLVANPEFRISPLILADNDRIRSIYPAATVADSWGLANSSITSLFHMFNILSNQPTPHTVFDKKDYDSVLRSGIVMYGAVPVKAAGAAVAREDIGMAIRDNINRNVLVRGMDLRTGKCAACIAVGDAETLGVVKQQDMEYGFSVLNRVLAPGAVVHRGIYQGARRGLTVYTMIGGLGEPVDRVRNLSALGRVQAESFGT